MSQKLLPSDMVVERDVDIPMSDGVILRANVYRPRGAVVPAVLSATPYGKDGAPDRKTTFFMRLAGVRFGHLNRSSLTGFESPDPQFWVRAGYAVVQADARGMHASGGRAGFLTDRDAADYAEVIEWVADRPWCTGRVGLNGVSYLCMSQWRVAPLRPRGLAAIVAWEGATDLLREFAHHGGIPETGFLQTWWKRRMLAGSHRGVTMDEDFPADAHGHPLDGDYWAAKRPDLARIDVPALVGASWSDHGLHTRGTLLAFEQLRGPKWLYVHGRRKWSTYYAPESLELQRRFFDHFLKDLDSWNDEPPVRYERRHTRDHFHTRTADSWPLHDAELRRLHLDAASLTLTSLPSPTGATASYESTRRRLSLSHRFSADTEITGSMRLTLFLSADADDLDVFVVLRKRDRFGKLTPFYGYNGFARDGVAKGWLRASQRELDEERSTPERPFLAHRRSLAVERNEPTELNVEIWPSSTWFESGSQLVVEICGHDADDYPTLRHRSVNAGPHTVHTGPNTPSALTFPVPGLCG